MSTVCRTLREIYFKYRSRFSNYSAYIDTFAGSSIDNLSITVDSSEQLVTMFPRRMLAFNSRVPSIIADDISSGVVCYL